MDNNEIDNTIINKVVNKQRAIFIVLENMPPTEDKFALCHQDQKISQSKILEEKPLNVNNDSEKNIEQDLTKNVSTDITKTRNSGIYKIINKVNGHYYVGKSRNLKDRWRKHKKDLNTNKHHCVYLQRAWNKDGADNFEIVVVEYVEPDDTLLTEVEQRYLDAFVENKKNGICNCYNIAITSDNNVMSEETKKKLSESLKGENHPFYGKTGKLHPWYGKTHSEETRKKLSESHKGKTHTEESKKKISQLKKGKTHTEESKKKMSESVKKLWADDGEYRKKRNESLTMYWSNEENRKKRGEPQKGKPRSEETKKKISESLKRIRAAERLLLDESGPERLSDTNGETQKSHTN